MAVIGLSFLHPGLLWGLALGAVPVIIHILNRRRFRRVPWAAMEFLLAAMRRNRRRLWLEELLLLLLRVAAVCLLAFLAARPLSSGSGLLAALAGDRGIHHLVVLDDSASMGQAAGGRTLFQGAATALEDLLEGLQSRRKGDRVTLLLSSRPDRPLLEGRPLTPESAALARDMVKDAEPTGVRLQPAALLERLSRNLEKYVGEEKQKQALYLLSDFRRADWAGEKEGPRPELTRLLEGLADGAVETWFIALPGREKEGLGVIDLEVVRPLLAAGVPVELRARIRNQGTTARPAVRPAVEAAGRVTPLPPTPTLAPGEEALVPFRVLFDRPGYHRIAVSLPGDDLPADNERHLVLRVQENSSILVIGETSREGLEGPGFYLTSAIDPGEVATGYQADICPAAKAATRDLTAYETVILAGVAAPHPDLAAKLEAFVRRGGGLLLFTGPQVVPPAWNKALDPLLPYLLGEPREERENPPAARLTAVESGLTARARDFFQAWLEQGIFPGHTAPAGPVRPDAQILARLGDPAETPLFSLRRVGAGRVFLAAVSADSAWSGWVGDPVFPLFVQEAVTWALREKPLEQWNRLCGESLAVPLDRERDKGAAELLPPGVPAPLALRSRGDRFRHDDTLHPGIYEFQISTTDAAGKRRVLRAANLHPREGQLRLAGKEELRSLYPQARFEWVVAAETREMARSGRRDKAWRVVAAILLLVLLLETGVGRRLARGRIF